MDAKNVLLAGSTGMIGQLVQQYCLEHAGVKKVTSLVRRPSGVTHPKLEEIIHSDFGDYSTLPDVFKNQDVAIFCIGVYTGQVDKELFRKINVDFPEQFGLALHAQNPKATMVLLSGAGADRTEKSRMQFARDKGAIENKLDAMGFGAFYSLRPSYIYPVTPRDEPSFTYKLSRFLYKPLIQFLGRNSSIKSTELAEGLVKAGLSGTPKTILENRDILDLIQG